MTDEFAEAINGGADGDGDGGSNRRRRGHTHSSRDDYNDHHGDRKNTFNHRHDRWYSFSSYRQRDEDSSS